jgi:hypothetical protein
LSLKALDVHGVVVEQRISGRIKKGRNVKGGRSLDCAWNRWMHLSLNNTGCVDCAEKFAPLFKKRDGGDAAAALDGAEQLALLWAYTGKEVDPADED